MLLWHTRALSQDDIKNRLAGNHLGTVTITQQLSRCRTYAFASRNFEINVPTVCGAGSERSCERSSHVGLQSRDTHKLTFMFRHEYSCGGPLCAVVCMRQFQQELHHPSIPLVVRSIRFQSYRRRCCYRLALLPLLCPLHLGTLNEPLLLLSLVFDTNVSAHMFTAVDASIISMLSTNGHFQKHFYSMHAMHAM